MKYQNYPTSSIPYLVLRTQKTENIQLPESHTLYFVLGTS